MRSGPVSPAAGLFPWCCRRSSRVGSHGIGGNGVVGTYVVDPAYTLRKLG